MPFFPAFFNSNGRRLVARFVLLGVFSVLVVGYSLFFYKNTAQNSPTREASLVLNGKKLSLEVADTSASREQGLSNREKLSTGSGMLFIFDKMGTYGFWMKDMKFSLDIMWLDADKKIIYIEKNVSPDTYPTIFTPPFLAQYVLEVPAGFVDNSHVSLGDFLNIEASLKRGHK